METGTIVAWDDVRFYGFIKPDSGGENVFFHRDAFGARLPAGKGERVVYLSAVRERGLYAQRADFLSEP